MTKQRVLITGGNAGIGLATAKGLAKKEFEVIIVARSEAKAEAALHEIKADSGNDALHYLVADLASQQQVRDLANDFIQQHNKLDVLVNNAGAYFSEFELTEDGIERQFAINHLAPFLLTNLLLDTLKDSAPSRIVNVASNAHYRGTINFEDVNHAHNYDGFRKAYAQSKLANVLFTYELHRRLKGTSVAVNALHPGVVRTDIAQKNANPLTNFFWGALKPFMVNTGKGAETSVYLASSPDVKGASGEYYVKCKPKKSSGESYDKEVALRLWELSEELTGLR